VDLCQSFTDHNNKHVTLRSVLKSKNMKLIITNFICFAFTERCYYDLTPLFYSTSIETGGLGLSPYHIGLIMSIWGFCNAFFQINMVGRLIRSYGGASVYKFGYICYLLSLLTFPLSACLARGNGSVGFGAWTVILIQLFFQFFSYMSYSSYYHLIVCMSTHYVICSLPPSCCCRDSSETVDGLYQWFFADGRLRDAHTCSNICFLFVFILHKIAGPQRILSIYSHIFYPLCWYLL